MVDMYYDHFLALEWQDWTGKPLEDDAHASTGNRDFMPHWSAEFRMVRPWLVGEDWLCSYRDTAHLDRSFRGLSRRLKVPGNRLHEGLKPLMVDYEGFHSDFSAFIVEALRDFRPPF
jgi:acyl carrier protein phosphodiesterase